MSLQNTTEFAFFYKATSGKDGLRGCTKAYLDSVNGNVDTLMDIIGAPIEVSDITVANNYTTNKIEIQEGGLVNVKPEYAGGGVIVHADSRAFLLKALDGNGVQELSEINPGVKQFFKSSLWAVVGCDEERSYLEITDGSDPQRFDGQYCEFFANWDYHVTELVIVDGNGQLVIEDGGSSNFESLGYNYDSGEVFFEFENADLEIGGASNDLQELLDNTDASLRSQWVFIGTNLNVDGIKISAVNAGNENYQTMLNVVGFVEHAYDSLPSGFGYFPASIPNGQYYKTAYDWLLYNKKWNGGVGATSRWVSLDAAVSAQKCVFKVTSAGTYNVRFMGFRYQNSVRYGQMVLMDNGTDAAYVSIRHCQQFENGIVGNDILLSTDQGNSGEVFDCMLAAPSLSTNCSPYIGNYTIISGGNSCVEVSHCCFKNLGNVTQRYGSLYFHDNLVIGCRYGTSTITDGAVIRHNNVYYPTGTGAANALENIYQLNGTIGRIHAWDEIIVINSASTGWLAGTSAIVKVAGGGQAFIDNCCFYNIQGTIINRTVYSLVAAWAGPTTIQGFGQNNIEADPKFVNAAELDFRLMPDSPCLGKGIRSIFGGKNSIGILNGDLTRLPYGVLKGYING
jgi:hypothetical protein